jgi:hypothetical protein
MSNTIHDLMSRAPSSIPQYRGDMNGFARELTQWLQQVMFSYFNDLSNAFQVTILKQIEGNPPQPMAGKAIIWVSDGTGKGDAGDVMVAVNDGTDTKYGTIFDFSAGTAW